MRLIARRLALACLLLLPLAARAADQDFTLVNRTGYEIDEVYVSSSASKSWGKDVLGDDVLEDRQSSEIEFPEGTRGCKWDLRVVYSDGDKAEWGGVNLCNVSKVTLFYNRKTDETRAVTE